MGASSRSVCAYARSQPFKLIKASIGDVEQNHTSIVNSTKLSIVAPSLWVTFMDGVQIDENLHYGGSLG